MNILIVSSYLPYPLFSGGHIRLYNLMKHIAKKHSITLICEMRKTQSIADIKEIEKLCKKVITVQRRKQWSIGNIIKSGFSKNSFLVTGHTIDEMQKHITEVMQSDTFDLIHAETFYILQNIPETNIPIVLSEHNIEYNVYTRFAQKVPFLLKPLLYADIAKLKRNEIHAWERSTKLLAVSEEERIEMSRKDVIVIPNGVDLASFPFKEYTVTKTSNKLPEKELLFIGDFKWMQNRDAVRWIISDIWPFLLRAVENDMKITLRIVGKNIPESLKAMKTYDSIHFDENAPKETVKIFQKADVLLAPIRVAGGTSYKILEAMASGVPVVTTSRGIKGLDAKADVHAIAADDTQTLVEKTARLLRDEKMFVAMTKNARELIEKKYNWDIISKELDAVYQSTIK